MARAEDLGGYYRVPADNRDLNYDLYFTEGAPSVTQLEDYNSHNTTRLDVDGMCETAAEAGGRCGADLGLPPRRRRSRDAARTSSPAARASSAATWWSRSGGATTSEAAAFDVDDPAEALRAALAGADVVFHLAGVNRPEGPGGVRDRQRRLHRSELCRRMDEAGARRPVVFASSIQAELDNPYGVSKRRPRRSLRRGRGTAAAPVAVFRLPNVFGKWCRPDYNSVRRHLLPQHRPRPADHASTTRTRAVTLVYVDDVVAAFLQALDEPPRGVRAARGRRRSSETTVGELAERIRAFRARASTRRTCPTSRDHFTRALYATYLSYLRARRTSPIDLDVRGDERGDLAELVQRVATSARSSSRARSRASPAATTTTTPRWRSSWSSRARALIRFGRVGGDDVRRVPGERRELRRCVDHPARLHALHRERGADGDGHALLGERGVRPGPARHVLRAACCAREEAVVKVATIVGTRPEIIRLSRVMAALDRHLEHVLVHTGQNYDYELNQIFFEDLELRQPDHFLEAAGATAAETIGTVIARADARLARGAPDAVLILGDTNSCLAAIAAKRRRSPCSTWRPATAASTSACPRRSTAGSSTTSPTSTCPTATSRGSTCWPRGCRPIGSSRPAARCTRCCTTTCPKIEASRRPGATSGSSPGGYFVVSAHREENVEDERQFAQSGRDAPEAGRPSTACRSCVSTHPRTRKRLEESGVALPPQVRLLKPFALHRLRPAARCTPGPCSRTRARSPRSPPSSTSRPSTSARPTSAPRGWRRPR